MQKKNWLVLGIVMILAMSLLYAYYLGERPLLSSSDDGDVSLCLEFYLQKFNDCTDDCLSDFRTCSEENSAGVCKLDFDDCVEDCIDDYNDYLKWCDNAIRDPTKQRT